MSNTDLSLKIALAHTALHNLHVKLGAKMVSFAGYSMPVHYPTGIIKEHIHTRSRAGLFDVSHMGQIHVAGANAALELESLMPMDIRTLELNRQRYALLTDDNGGILDDLMISRAATHFSVVVNAARKAEDFTHFRQQLSAACTVEARDDLALLALQGPQALQVMARLAPPAVRLTFLSSATMDIAGVECLVNRAGYTGEDGFEISVANIHAELLARTLLAEPEVAPIGLGARDSLRLEAGLCLYGHDIDTDTTPVEASLAWALSKSRHSGFPGADVIRFQMENGPPRRRVGIHPEGRLPLREGTVLLNDEGIEVGKITSGGFGPSLGGPIAMGYIEVPWHVHGSMLHAIIRGKSIACQTVKLPFVPHRYFRN